MKAREGYLMNQANKIKADVATLKKDVEGINNNFVKSVVHIILEMGIGQASSVLEDAAYDGKFLDNYPEPFNADEKNFIHRAIEISKEVGAQIGREWRWNAYGWESHYQLLREEMKKFDSAMNNLESKYQNTTELNK